MKGTLPLKEFMDLSDIKKKLSWNVDRLHKTLTKRTFSNKTRSLTRESNPSPNANNIHLIVAVPK